MRALCALRDAAAILLLAIGLALPALAQDETPAEVAPETASIVSGFAGASLRELAEAVAAIAVSGDEQAVPVLRALGDGDLYETGDGGVYIRIGSGPILDAATGAEAETVTAADLSLIRINNSLRRDIRAAIGNLTLLSEDTSVRRRAAAQMFSNPDPANIELLDEAIAAEDNGSVLTLMTQARAAALLRTDVSGEAFSQAIAAVSARGDRAALTILTAAMANADDAERADIEAGIARINQQLALWNIGQNAWYGISLGSVLLLAAIGLAITFGVMGVINMAHGEMVMIGAYVTFMVQEVIRTTSPFLFDYSLAIAVPLAFLVTALIGMAIERGIIRWLYGRALETLLATWGLSLIIQQGVRTIFGATNRDVGNPSWMTGAFELGGMSITWSRFWILIFALVVFLLLLFVLKRTPLGLQMRAVTQNRRMASAMGIKTPWVDAMTFGLGSGVAGLAGVALSQIDNVSPNLGQGYIIDSFMVVVFGGVGNLWGTLVGAMTLGVFRNFLQPYTGAVLAQIVLLVFIILFIQRRPRGLFALKGRAVDA